MNPATILTAAEALQAVLTIAQESLKLFSSGKITNQQLQAIWVNTGINLTQAEQLFKSA